MPLKINNNRCSTIYTIWKNSIFQKNLMAAALLFISQLCSNAARLLVEPWCCYSVGMTPREVCISLVLELKTCFCQWQLSPKEPKNVACCLQQFEALVERGRREGICWEEEGGVSNVDKSWDKTCRFASSLLTHWHLSWALQHPNCSHLKNWAGKLTGHNCIANMFFCLFVFALVGVTCQFLIQLRA